MSDTLKQDDFLIRPHGFRILGKDQRTTLVGMITGRLASSGNALLAYRSACKVDPHSRKLIQPALGTTTGARAF
jgi:hypothetical protein